MSPHTRIGSSYGHPYPSSSANATSVAAAPEMSATTQGRARNSKAKERARTKPIRAAAHRAQRAHLKGSFGLGFLMHPRQFVIPRSSVAFSRIPHLSTLHLTRCMKTKELCMHETRGAPLQPTQSTKHRTLVYLADACWSLPSLAHLRPCPSCTMTHVMLSPPMPPVVLGSSARQWSRICSQISGSGVERIRSRTKSTT